ncbi:MAG TPA: ATP-binding protein [Candidatus Saccharimonadales bacterium]|nr:ATP-binding protein [Candidatus Saccharimonadales bacterium]
MLFRKLKAAHQRKGGLTVSEQAEKDSRLGSDFILSAIEDGVVLASRDGRVNLFNPGAAVLTGWKAEEAVNSDIYHVLPLIDAKGHPLPAEQHPFAQAIASGKAVRNPSTTLATKSGKTLTISLVVSPILDEKAAPTGNVVGIFRDVTREKEQEEQRNDFISTASHEMRTPLAAIEGYLSLALNPKISQIDPNAQKYIQKAADATKHLGQLFQDLLTSSRAEDGRITSYPVVVEMGEVLTQVVESERFRAKEKSLALNYAVSAPQDVAGGKVIKPLYYCFADPNRLTEVLQNIIDNAVKYTPQGSITVRLTGDGSVIQIQVSDTGIGIPSEDIPHLFQKFYRVDNTATRTIGGTGLGLYICKKILQLYNGSIWVESTLSNGSTFYINLPRLTTEQALNMQKNQAGISSPVA